MKLPDKKTIAVQKSAERKMEIEEGMKLAKKIDILRETASEEQAHLAQFRGENLALLKKEIDPMIEERDKLRKDIEFLREQKRILLEIPLDAEWKSVEAKNHHLTSVEVLLNDKKNELIDRDNNIRQRLAVIRRKEDEADQVKLASQKLYNEAQEKLDEISIIHTREKEKELISQHEREDKKINLLTRELSIAARERDASIKESHLKEKEYELINKERSINDKYETLIRTTKRIQGNGIISTTDNSN